MMIDYAESVQDLNQELLKRGVRLNDELRVSPILGRQFTYILKRTRLLLSSAESEKGEDIGTGPMSIVFARPQGAHAFKCELLLVKGGRFMARSLCPYPFRINGQLSYVSFIERGDKLKIGDNDLEFLYRGDDEKNSDNDNDDWHSILREEGLLQSDLPIMIEGETGTGKSTLAKAIHERSKVKGAFVQLNIQSFSANLLESELFGHVRGAFTGALQEKLGAIREANYGTLFLDEIDSLPLSTQTKLLIFLDSKKVRPLGGHKEEKANVRFIFASGSPLLSLVQKGEMRKDFYYRLSAGVSLLLPPLRKDSHKIRRICQHMEKEIDVVIAESLLQFYLTLPWPGNIRQLVAHLKCKKVLSKTRKLIFDNEDRKLLEYDQQAISREMAEGNVVRLQDRKYWHALEVFQKTDGNCSRGAKLLNITPQTMRKILQHPPVVA